MMRLDFPKDYARAPTPPKFAAGAHFDCAVLERPDGWLVLVGRPGQVARWRGDAALMKDVYRVVRDRDFNRLARLLGYDFTLMAYSGGEDRLALSRGGVGRYRLYFATGDDGVTVTNRLEGGGSIDMDAAAAYLAQATQCGAFDVNHTVDTASRRFKRVPRAAVIEISPAKGTWKRTDFTLPDDGACAGMAEDDLEAAIRDAMDDTIETYAGNANTVEVSGGIDSTIVASRLKKLRPDAFETGLSIEYPYYEFRFERPKFIEPVYDMLGITPVWLDGASLGVFTPSDLPYHDEPAFISIGMKQMELSFAAAGQAGADVIFNGQGGDQVMGVIAGEWQPPPDALKGIGWLKPDLADACRAQMDALAAYMRGDDPDRPHAFYSGIMLHDGWPEFYYESGTGIRYECGFVSARLFDLVQAWRRLYPDRRGFRKRAARHIFRDDLPPAIRDRRGKVAYNGAHIRSFIHNRGHIRKLIDRNRDALEQLGVDTGALRRNIDVICTGKSRSRRAVTAVLALALWLDAKRGATAKRKAA